MYVIIKQIVLNKITPFYYIILVVLVAQCCTSAWILVHNLNVYVQTSQDQYQIFHSLQIDNSGNVVMFEPHSGSSRLAWWTERQVTTKKHISLLFHCVLLHCCLIAWYRKIFFKEYTSRVDYKNWEIEALGLAYQILNYKLYMWLH